MVLPSVWQQWVPVPRRRDRQYSGDRYSGFQRSVRLIGPACAKLSLYLSKSYSNKLEEIVEIPEEEEAEQKTELELLIQRIQAIQEELPKHDDPFYEDEKAFSEAAEEHCFQFNEEH